MRKILVVSDNYPNEKYKYSDVFVHTRVKEYMKHFSVDVIGMNKNSPERFTYEGVNVRNFRKREDFVEYIKNNQPDVLIIHFLSYWMVDSIIKKFKLPTIIWIHGFEIYAWYRRLFNFSISIDFAKTFVRSYLQAFYWRKLLRYAKTSNLVHFVFVSEWLRKVAEQDCFMKFNHYHIIPNPIDTDAFHYSEKDPSLRTRVLMIRSFETRKYANDIAIGGILELSKHPEFSEFEFDINGDGKLFDSLTDKVKHFANVQIHKSFIENKLIPDIQDKNGIFLCPTRQDTHGVSMCEAMSSGLIPITCNNTAIPEFVTEHKTGIFADTPREIANALIELKNNPQLFNEISKNTARSIRNICGKDFIISKEIDLINQM